MTGCWPIGSSKQCLGAERFCEQLRNYNLVLVQFDQSFTVKGDTHAFTWKGSYWNDLEMLAMMYPLGGPATECCCIFSLVCLHWLLSLYLVGAACAQWEIGESFVKDVDQNFSFSFYWPIYAFNESFYWAMNILTSLLLFFSFCTFNNKFPLERERSPRGELEFEGGTWT